MFAKVVPLRRMPKNLSVLDYRIPTGMKITTGMLVMIPFRKKDIFGLVLSRSNSSTISTSRVADISSAVFNHSLLSSAQTKLALSISQQYSTPLYAVLLPMLPPLQPRKLQKVELEPFVTNKNKFESRYLWYEDLEEKKKWIEKQMPEIASSPSAPRNDKTSQVLIVVPEKWHIEEWQELLSGNIESATSYHSDISVKEKFETYFNVRNGKACVIIGTKAALFLPIKNLSHIIVDFEQNQHHKNWDQAPRYHVREIADQLARLAGTRLTVMSHTPSVEAAGRLIVHPRMRVRPIKSPCVQLADMREERKKKNYDLFSDAALDQIKETIRKRKDILIVVHRRGNYTVSMCSDCGNVERCSNCSLPMVVHERGTMQCHPCGIQVAERNKCNFCGGTRKRGHGIGTQQVHTQIKQIAINAPYLVQRIDSDVKKIQSPSFEKPVILVGTTGALSLVRWGRIGLVCFVDVDSFLSLAEFRAASELLYLLRGIRYRMPSTAPLLIQTKEPHRNLLQAVSSGFLGHWYKGELAIRRQLHYPPNDSILKLTTWQKADASSMRAAQNVHNMLATLTSADKSAIITPPFQTAPHQKRGLYGATVLLRMPNATAKTRFTELLEQLNLGTTWKIDRDPLTLLN